MSTYRDTAILSELKFLSHAVSWDHLSGIVALMDAPDHCYCGANLKLS